MLDAHSEPAQSVVVGAFILCQRPRFGFLVGDIDAGMIILKSLVAAVGMDAGIRRQRRSASADFKIVNPARRWFGDADDPAIPGDDDFSFDGVAFLLGSVVPCSR